MRKIYAFALFVAMTFLSVSCDTCCNNGKVRLLYWNFQNGMWSGQADNYDAFVKFVNEQNPDICVWCEAQSIFKTGTAEKCDTADRYLVANMDKLAARYGHKYVFIGGHRDNYPQAITSRYPIEGIERIVGAMPDSVVSHGAGWAKIKVAGHDINFVTAHTWPQAYAFGVPKTPEDRAASAAVKGGDHYRRLEVEYITKHTIATDPNAAENDWIFLGDLNSRSIVDNELNGHNWPADDTRWLTQNYIIENTPYVDIVREKHPGVPLSTTYGASRIDYVYLTPALVPFVKRADIIKDEYTTPVKAEGVSNFYYPSDHLPIVVDFDFNK